MSSSLRPAAILATTAAVGLTAALGYAIYFDHRRRTDPEFRKSLKRESRREARIAKDQEQASQRRQRAEIQALIQDANAEGYPTGTDAKEGYFMEMVAEGEQLSNSGELLEAAFCFYRALKVYPNQADLISIYDKTVQKPVIDLLAEFIAADGTIRVTGSHPSSTGAGSVRSAGDSAHGVDD